MIQSRHHSGPLTERHLGEAGGQRSIAEACGEAAGSAIQYSMHVPAWARQHRVTGRQSRRTEEPDGEVREEIGRSSRGEVGSPVNSMPLVRGHCVWVRMRSFSVNSPVCDLELPSLLLRTTTQKEPRLT